MLIKLAHKIGAKSTVYSYVHLSEIFPLTKELFQKNSWSQGLTRTIVTSVQLLEHENLDIG